MTPPHAPEFTVTIYTDGSCRPNPGPGGWAALLCYVGEEGKKHWKKISGSALHSTNNQMELEAVFRGITTLKAACNITIVTDSQLVIGWLSLGWKRNFPDNDALCSKIEELIAREGHCIQFQKVEAHTDHPQNDVVDRLAKQESSRFGLKKAMSKKL